MSIVYAQHAFTDYSYSVNICRVVLSMYLQNTHMLSCPQHVFTEYAYAGNQI